MDGGGSEVRDMLRKFVMLIYEGEEDREERADRV